MSDQHTHTITYLPGETDYQQQSDDKGELSQFLKEPTTVTGRLLSHLENRYVDLIIQGNLSQKQIQQALAIPHISLLRRLERDPDIRQHIEDQLETFRRHILQSGMARRELRIQNQNQRHQQIQSIINQRRRMIDPTDPFYMPGADLIPGADTGLLTRKLKAVGSGPAQRIVEEWELDTSLLQELRLLETQIAVETGQHREHRTLEITGKAYIGIDIDRV
jgi:hypothetical protein